jgi:hypothetical protein
MTFVWFSRRLAPVLAGLTVSSLITFTGASAAATARPAATTAPANYQALAVRNLDHVARTAGDAAAATIPAQAPNDVWSGAVVHTTSTAVHASWVEPQVTCGATTTYGAIWVGIDGDGSNTVEQTGTQESCNGGHLSADGWYQMYPKPAYGLPTGHIVQPGDRMRATVTYEGSGVFLLQLRNVTLQWLATERLTATNAARVSAEVVIETPESKTANLNDFKTVSFTNVSVNHRRLGAWDNEMVRYNLVADNGTAEDTTSVPSGASFSVKRDH